MSLLPDSIDTVGTLDTVDYGEVFTRRWVVELILDVCGYTADRDLAGLHAVEPACGSGAFLIPMIERFVESARTHGRALTGAFEALRATDLLAVNVAASRNAAEGALANAGVPRGDAAILAEAWVRQADFLLEPPPVRSADLVVGNPPYIRLEDVPNEVSDAYRRACPTMAGRADVYVGFYEQGLRALRDGGMLGFICADRWMRNAYGARLREFVSRDWAVDAVISMTGVDAFEEEVDAYPAITVLRRGLQTTGPLVVDTDPEFCSADAVCLTRDVRAGAHGSEAARFRAARLSSWFTGQAGWPHGSPAQLAALADIESRLAPLEDKATGTRVGIGVATGADRVFIVDDPGLAEPERMLPLAMARDTTTGQLRWSGKYLVNPWDQRGLIDLGQWPKAQRYLSEHKTLLAQRHTAKSGMWHKTIDRVIEGLAAKDKLYLPDFKDVIFPVLDRGETYPHHNLYWVTTDKWDLEVLGGILLSDIANLFISAYSVRMRGGYLRFQAQYLRRIRIPAITSVDDAAATELREAFRARNRERATKTVLPLYGLDTLPR
jgi:hypothetical protein